MLTVKRRIYGILSVSQEKKDLSWYVDLALIILIILNVLAVILESVPSIHQAYRNFFVGFEWFSVGVFSVEYCLRVWTITESEEYRHPIWGRLRFIFSPAALVDLVAISPFYFGIFVQYAGLSSRGFDARFMRILRVFRLFRLLKVLRYVAAMRVINNVFRSKKEELLISLSFILFMLLMVSCLMYYVERDVEGTLFVSIPATMWWGVATLTTVGYGDIYPLTPLGKVLGGVIAILGIGLFALPTGILAAGTAEEISKSRKKESDEGVCPKCGRPFSDHTHLNSSIEEEKP